MSADIRKLHANAFPEQFGKVMTQGVQADQTGSGVQIQGINAFPADAPAIVQTGRKDAFIRRVGHKLPCLADVRSLLRKRKIGTWSGVFLLRFRTIGH